MKHDHDKNKIVPDCNACIMRQYFSTNGKKGGKARLTKMSFEERQRVSMLGVEARKAKKEAIVRKQGNA